MARGTEAKQRRKSERKEARIEANKATKEGEEPGRDIFEEVLKKDGLSQAAEGVENNDDDSEEEEDSSDDDSSSYEDSSEDEKKEDIMTKAVKKNSMNNRSRSAASKSGCGSSCCAKPSSNGKGIKMMPLIFLLIMTGTTIIPVVIYLSDNIGSYMQKNHVMGSIGYKLGIGTTPKRRVVSFYEKHDPSKVPDVPKLMSKYYGQYPKLIKRLERKYNDYGYFLQWQEDDAPSKLAKEKLWETYDNASEYLDLKFRAYAPRWMKSRVRNVKYNLKYLARKSKKVWKKQLWPLLEPIFGVPKGGEAQKRKDRQKAQKDRKRGKYAYRDEEYDTDGFTTEE